MASREEEILRATIDGTEYTGPVMSRVEALLLELKEAIEAGGGGGGGGTTNYNQLTNKPSINAITLSGNKSLADLGAASASDLAKVIKPVFATPQEPYDGQMILWCHETTEDFTYGGWYEYVVVDNNGDWVEIYIPTGGGASYPAGGTTGQALVKKSNADDDVEWKTIEGGGSTTLSGLTDVDLDNLDDDNILMYDETDEKWHNTPLPQPDLTPYQTKTITSFSIAGTAVSTVEDALAALKDYSDALDSAKQNNLTFDATPTSGSDNPVTSDGVYDALDALDQAKQDNLTFDATPTSGSDNPVTSDGIYDALAEKINTSLMGAANGVATLDNGGMIPAIQLPSYVDDVVEGTAGGVTETGAGTYTATSFTLTGESSPVTPEDGKTYIDTTSNIQYRWTGSTYASMGSNLALGENQRTAFRGDHGKAAYDHSQITDGTNPHNTTYANVASKPQKATMSDLTITDPGRKAYGEIIDLTGKEYVVGDYILADGTRKPLYQKTIYISALPAKGDTGAYGLGGANIDFVYVVNAFSRYTANGTGYSFDLPLVWPGDVSAEACIYFQYGTSDTTMHIRIGATADFGGQPATITVRYTKTTDTPT